MASQRSSMEKEKYQIDEKPQGSAHVEGANHVVEIDTFRVLGLNQDDTDFYTSFPEDKRKKVFHKIDIRLIPMLAALYLICHIDRANIGNAKIEGMVKDLGMTNIQYNIVLSIFFVPYVLFEIPSNMILKKFKRPSWYIGILCLLWGTTASALPRTLEDHSWSSIRDIAFSDVAGLKTRPLWVWLPAVPLPLSSLMTLTGVVQNFAGLMTTRLLLGIFEAGFFPGAIYLCSYWYMPRDLATRISYFYCASALSGAFSGLLAAGISKMDGVGGYEGWRWIFLLEGIMTVILGVACFFLLIDTPALSTKWLNPEEIRYLELSMFIKQGGAFSDEQSSKKRDLKKVLGNWRIYVQAYFLVCQSALSYGMKFTLPTITKAMGFTNTVAQLTSAPPYVFAAVSAVVFAKFSDKFYWRMPFLVAPLGIVAIAFSVMFSLNGALDTKKGVAYFAVCLGMIGIFPIQAAAASWNANNIAPASRRNIGIALMNATGNVGGIIGSFMYLESEKPKYPTGFGLSLAFGASGLIVALLLEWSYKAGNAKKAKIAEEAQSKYTEEELFDMGDKSPLFKYVL